MTNTDILLEDLEDVLDDATSIPLSKKYAVDVDKIKTIIEDIRLNTPQETKQAKAIVDSRNNILEEAKKEAADIIAKAQEEARELVARDQITQTAQAEAADIIAKAKEQGDSYIADAQNQASDILGNATNQANEMVTTAQNKSEKCLQQLIIMLMIHFLLLMIHFIRHSVMFAEFAKVLKIHKTKISNFESYWAAYGRLKL